MNKYLGIAALVIIASLGLTVWLHGNARYSEGKADCSAQHATTAATAATESAQRLERIQDETNHMPDSAIDDDLARLGIMRQPADR